MTLNGAEAAVIEYYQVPPGGPFAKIEFTDTI